MYNAVIQCYTLCIYIYYIYIQNLTTICWMSIIQKLIFVNGDILMSGDYGVNFDLFEKMHLQMNYWFIPFNTILILLLTALHLKKIFFLCFICKILNQQ